MTTFERQMTLAVELDLKIEFVNRLRRRARGPRRKQNSCNGGWDSQTFLGSEAP
jgi:hypothetical protein